MPRVLLLLIAVATAILATGCASVTGSPIQNISVQTRDPDGMDVTGAQCELQNNKGRWLLITPGSVVIGKSNQDMQIACSKEGMEPTRQTVVSETKGSMYGNIILGGAIGAVIDHNSGAAYEYPSFIRLSMRALGKQSEGSEVSRATSSSPQAIASTTAPLATSTTTTNSAASKPLGRKPRIGDEWEYLAVDKVFGKRKKLVWRIKGIEPEGILEELIVDGIPSQQWLFTNKPEAIAAPIEMGFVFGQHWDTQSALPALSVRGAGECSQRFQCSVEGKIVGLERIIIDAGTFDAIRIDGDFIARPVNSLWSRPGGKFSVWYSEKDRRLLKQVAQVKTLNWVSDETLELQMARSRP